METLEFIDLESYYPFLNKIIFDNYDIILEEFKNLSLFDYQAWPELDLYPGQEKYWTVFILKTFSYRVEKNCLKFPATLSIFDDLVKNYGYQIFNLGFSRLAPGTHIHPHRGYPGFSEKVFRIHVPLIIPSPLCSCSLRVGNSIKNWQPGKLMGFDDSNVHEAWNNSDSHRIVLLFDIAREKGDVKFKADLSKDCFDLIKKETNFNNLI